MGLGLGLKAADSAGAKLCAIVVHKSLVSCIVVGVCFSTWFMSLGLGLGLGWGCIWFWFWGLVGLGPGWDWCCLRAGYRSVVEEIRAQHLRSAPSPLIDNPSRPLLLGVADLLVACNGIVLRRWLAMQDALPVNNPIASVKQIHDSITITLLLLFVCFARGRDWS